MVWLIIFFTEWAVLAILFAFLDLGISQKLYKPDTNWAIFLENYGQVPGILVGLLGMNVLLRLQKGKSWKSILAIIGLVIFILLFGFMVGGELQGQQSGQEASPVLSAIIGLALAAGMQVWFRLTPEATMQKYKTPALVVVFLILLSGFVTTWTLKILWGRWTYRDIVDAGNIALFTPWYLPQGPNGYNSFPSGHTNFALMVLPLLLLIPKKKQMDLPCLDPGSYLGSSQCLKPHSCRRPLFIRCLVWCRANHLMVLAAFQTVRGKREACLRNLE